MARVMQAQVRGTKKARRAIACIERKGMYLKYLNFPISFLLVGDVESQGSLHFFTRGFFP
tara:strand:+ start:332 stop:511 length:180 start_codon:yes stop_codon:yes gene_type:complete